MATTFTVHVFDNRMGADRGRWLVSGFPDIELAREFAATAPFANRGVKRALARSAGASLADQLSFEAEEQSVCFESEDIQEGLAAARERRSPHFRGN